MKSAQVPPQESPDFDNWVCVDHKDSPYWTAAYLDRILEAYDLEIVMDNSNSDTWFFSIQKRS